MPFSKKFNSVYGEIKQACIEMMIECNRSDDYFSNSAIMENILMGIISSELVIADLSGLSSNVFYELGIAHTLKDESSVILITQEIKSCPFDINHRSILIYDIRNTFKFRENLKQKILFSREYSKKKDFFKTFLKSHKIDPSEIEKFIEISERLSKERYDIVYEVLSRKTNSIESDTVSNVLNYFIKLEDYKDGEIQKATLIIKLNFLTSAPVVSNTNFIRETILRKSRHDLINLDDIEATSFLADFCFALIEKDKVKKYAINWLIDYLHNYRMGRIDVVRTRIEEFFINTDDRDIEAAILSMLESEKVQQIFVDKKGFINPFLD